MVDGPDWAGGMPAGAAMRVTVRTTPTIIRTSPSTAATSRPVFASGCAEKMTSGASVQHRQPIQLGDEREPTSGGELRLVYANLLEEPVHTPELNTMLPHSSAQSVICPQISVTRDNSVSVSVYGSGQHRVILGIAATRWHGNRFHPFAAQP
jgi:hypothetical protein